MSKVLDEVLAANARYAAALWRQGEAADAAGPSLCDPDLHGRAPWIRRSSRGWRRATPT